MRDAMDKLLEGKDNPRPKGNKVMGDGAKVKEHVTVSLQKKEGVKK